MHGQLATLLTPGKVSQCGFFAALESELVMPVRLNRRDLIRGVVGTAATVSAGGGMLLPSRKARAFGQVPGVHATAMMPEDLQVESILEVFLFGGVSQYESFYTVESHGQGSGTGWYLHLNSGELDNALSDCNYPANEPLTQEFHQDDNGVPVSLGPFALPLRRRGDLLDRMRICVTAHDALPHEVAVPLSFTGRRLGHPRMAGLGTHIQRFFMDRAGSGPPSSYVLYPSNRVVSDLVRAAFAPGAHSAAAQPVPVVIDQATNLLDLLSRDAVGDQRAPHDELVKANLSRMDRRLRWKTADERLRSRAVTDAESAAAAIARAQDLLGILREADLEPRQGERCSETNELDTTSMSMQLAAHMLTSPNSPARYVSVVDAGFVGTNEAGGFDTHRKNCTRQAHNVPHALEALSSVVNGPSENDPGKINLDKTLIIINTEFGRTPQGENQDSSGRWGRGHWPHGYPVLFLGGPIGKTSRGVFGATDGGAKATKALAAQEHRIAALLALGIWPFEPESYNVSDAVDSAGEGQAVTNVLSRVFGVGS